MFYCYLTEAVNSLKPGYTYAQHWAKSSEIKYYGLLPVQCQADSVNKNSVPQDCSTTQFSSSTMHAWVVTEWPLQCLH